MAEIYDLCVRDENGQAITETKAQEALAEAYHSNPIECVVIGYDENGRFFYSSDINSKPDILWLLELAKKELL